MSLLSSLFGGPRQDIYPNMDIFDRTSKAFLAFFHMLYEDYYISEFEHQDRDKLSYAMCIYIATLLTVICMPHRVKLEYVKTEAHCKLILHLFRLAKLFNGEYNYRISMFNEEHAALLGIQGDQQFNRDQLTDSVLTSLIKRAKETDNLIREMRVAKGREAFQDELFTLERGIYLENELDKKEAVMLLLWRISDIYRELAKNESLGLEHYELSLFGSLLKPLFKD